MAPSKKQQRPDNDERAKKTLYVTGFNSKHTTKHLLKELFTQGGPVRDITMFDTHAYVQFQHEESVPYCFALFNEVELFGDRLRLNPRCKTQQSQSYMKYLTQVRAKLRDENKNKEPPRLPPKKYSESPKKQAKSPHRTNRSPHRTDRSPQRTNRSPSRTNRTPGRTNRSPNRTPTDSGKKRIDFKVRSTTPKSASQHHDKRQQKSQFVNKSDTTRSSASKLGAKRPSEPTKRGKRGGQKRGRGSDKKKKIVKKTLRR